jgi:DNA modification methylase
MKPLIIHGDARHLPLKDTSVDLIVTSPPYFGLRSYTDGGQHYDGQIGSEATPAEWLANLIDCTREWVRVLKPSGSLFVNLGDRYVTSGGPGGATSDPTYRCGQSGRGVSDGRVTGAPVKSLLGLPWRYAHACTDQLGLILRAEIIWAKTNGLPESVTDRVRRSHEQLFHFTVQPRYYSAIDEIREPHTGTTHPQAPRPPVQSGNGVTHRTGGFDGTTLNPLGKLPGSVWSIPSAPLTIPAHLGVDHFAAFPPALVRPIVLGWSPPGVCVACGEGRRPVVDKRYRTDHYCTQDRRSKALRDSGEQRGGITRLQNERPFGVASTEATITGYACACSTTDLPGPDVSDYAKCRAREPPTRPAVVLDPFGGTGTTALVASVHGRHGISVDLSADYCRLAAWRCHDPGERARAADVPKPPAVPDGQEPLFELR